MADLKKVIGSYDSLAQLLESGRVERTICSDAELRNSFAESGPLVKQLKDHEKESCLSLREQAGISDQAQKLLDAAWQRLKTLEAKEKRHWLEGRVLAHDESLKRLVDPSRDPDMPVLLQYWGDLHRAVQITRDLIGRAMDYPPAGDIYGFESAVAAIRTPVKGEKDGPLDAAWALYKSVLPKSGKGLANKVGPQPHWLFHGPLVAVLGKKKMPKWPELVALDDAALTALALDERNRRYVLLGAKLDGTGKTLTQVVAIARKGSEALMAELGLTAEEAADVVFRTTPKEERRAKGEDETIEDAAAKGNAVAKALVKLDGQEGDGRGNGHGKPANAVIDGKDPRFLGFFVAKAAAANLAQGQFAQKLGADAAAQKAFEAEYFAWLGTFGNDGDPIAEQVLAEAQSVDIIFDWLNLGQRELALATLPTMDDAALATAGVSPMGIQHLRRFIPAPAIEEKPAKAKKNGGAHKNGKKGTSRRGSKGDGKDLDD